MTSLNLFGLLVAPVLILAGCTEQVRNHSWLAMETNLSVTLFGEEGVLSDEKVFESIEFETARLESLFTDYSTRSGLAQVRGAVGETLLVDPEIYGVLKTALEMSHASHGAFDITLHDLKTVWGLDGAHTGTVPDRRTLDSTLRENPVYGLPLADIPAPPLTLLPGHRVIVRRQHVQLDLGGIAKGYIVDRIHRLLDSLGNSNHIVQAGGDIRVGGRKSKGSWNVGIRHPRNPDSLAGTIRSDRPFSVSTAGDYERFFIRDGVRYHHIFDPRTGMPVQGVSAVTVIAPTSEAADAIDDALFVLGPQRGLELAKAYGVEAVWFLETEAGLCAIVMPEMRTLTLQGVRRCAAE